MGKVLVPDTQNSSVPSSLPNERQALNPHSPISDSDTHLTPRMGYADNTLGLTDSQVSNDTVDGYLGTPPGLCDSATSTQFSNSTIDGYKGTPESPLPTSAQPPALPTASLSPGSLPATLPTRIEQPGFSTGIYGLPPAPPLNPALAHPLHANAAGAEDISWEPTQDGPIKEYFKTFDVRIEDDSDEALELKMNNAVLKSLNNVIRNCESSAEPYSSDLILGFLFNAVYGAYESGSNMLGWDKASVARQVSFHANQTDAFQERLTDRFDPDRQHSDEHATYASNTIPPYSHDILSRERGVTLFHDQEGNSVCGFDDGFDAHNTRTVLPDNEDVVMERSKESLKDSIHAAPTPVDTFSRASSLPLANDFCEMILGRVQALERYVGMPGKGKNPQIPKPNTMLPSFSYDFSCSPSNPLFPKNVTPSRSTHDSDKHATQPPVTTSVTPDRRFPTPRIDNTTSFPPLLPNAPPDIEEFSPALSKNQRKAAKRAEKKRSMAETVVEALRADPAHAHPVTAAKRTPTSSNLPPTSPATNITKIPDLSIVARFHTNITQEGRHKLPARLIKERVDAFFKKRAGTGNIRLSTANWNDKGNLIMNFPPSTNASLIFNNEDDLKKALSLPGPCTFVRNAAWKKVLLNGVCTGLNQDGSGSIYDSKRLTQELRDAHAIFRNMKFTQEPRFLATREQILGHEHKSVLICFEDTNGQVWNDLKATRFNMFAKPITFIEFNDKPTLQVCLKCHSYDHSGAENKCKATALCAICAREHSTSKHKTYCPSSCKGSLLSAPVTHAKTCGACKRLNDKAIRWDHEFNDRACPLRARYRIPAAQVLRTHTTITIPEPHPTVPVSPGDRP